MSRGGGVSSTVVAVVSITGGGGGAAAMVWPGGSTATDMATTGSGTRGPTSFTTVGAPAISLAGGFRGLPITHDHAAKVDFAASLQQCPSFPVQSSV